MDTEVGSLQGYDNIISLVLATFSDCAVELFCDL